MWFLTYAFTRGCDSATRQNSASQSLSSTTQLTWQRAGSVCQRCVLEVLKRTWLVEPTGLYESSTALIGRSLAKAAVMAAVMAAVILLHAMSASSWYMSCAGWVPPLHTRWLSSHSRVMRLSWPNRCSLGASPASRHLV